MAYGGAGGDHAYAVQPTADGGYIVAATTQLFGVGNPWAWLLRLDTHGSLMWQRAYGGVASFANAVQTTTDGGYVVAGDWWVGSFPPHAGGGSHTEAWVARLGASGEITGSCAVGGTIDAATADGNAVAKTTVATVAAGSTMEAHPTTIPVNSTAVPTQQCP